MTKTYTRRRSGKAFTYHSGETIVTAKAALARIKKLAIPPAWKEVQISASPSEKVQASGIDSAGRKQAIYHETYRSQQDDAKFMRILSFANKLPSLRQHIEKDMRRRKLDKAKVLATVVKLIDEAYFRPGNEIYAKEHQTYGITTMRSKHLDITTTSVTFDFVGKSSQKHHKVIKDAQIARIMKQLDEMPGHDVFRYVDESGVSHPITSQLVNQYIKDKMGDDYSAKDFRTWGGTMIAASNLAIEKRASSERDRKKSVTSVVKSVAKRLGNTPAVARSSYIDPRIIDAYMGGDAIKKVYDTINTMKPHKYLKPEERAVIKLLKSSR